MRGPASAAAVNALFVARAKEREDEGLAVECFCDEVSERFAAHEPDCAYDRLWRECEREARDAEAEASWQGAEDEIGDRLGFDR